MEGGIAHQLLLCQKTRVVVLLCGIKISAVHCFVLSQCMHVTDRHYYDFQESPRIDARL